MDKGGEKIEGYPEEVPFHKCVKSDFTFNTGYTRYAFPEPGSE
jgi:hypothetical protein